MPKDNVYYYEDLKAAAQEMRNELEIEAAVKAFGTIEFYYNLLPDIKAPGDEIALIVAMDQRIKQMMSEMSEEDLKMLDMLRTAMDAYPEEPEDPENPEI